jgi:D-xylose transport system permease protein
MSETRPSAAGSGTTDTTGTDTLGKGTGGAALDVIDPRLLVREQGMRGYLDLVGRRIRGGELGALPVVVGLVLIWVIFYLMNDRFLSAQNLTNLSLQIAATGTISVGIVLVLLLGEIDLSVGQVSGLCGAVLAVLMIKQDTPQPLAVVAAIAVGVGIGLLQGFFFAKVGVPAFVVTLAGLIGWQGLQLHVLGDTGTLNLPYEGFLHSLMNTYITQIAIGNAIGAVIVGVYLLTALRDASRRRAAGLPARPVSEIALRAGGLALAVFLTIAVFNQYNGVPVGVLIFVGFVVVFDFVLRRTGYGRRVFAVGGNIEAARRAGINVAAIRMSVFALASMMAAIGGILFASRGHAVGQNSGGGDILLNAIAAAVIGGTSLFGGRGSTYAALLGMLVIGSISSGLDLEGVGSPIKFMITGAVLLAAVTIDSLSRRGRQSTGRG